MAAQQPSNQNPGEYELVPHDRLELLRHEVEKIKRNPFGDTQSSKDLLSSMDALNKNLVKLIAIFETANDEIVRDYRAGANTERLNKVLDQNEKLARGIIIIADLLKELKEMKGSLSPPTPLQNPSSTPLSSNEALHDWGAIPTPMGAPGFPSGPSPSPSPGSAGVPGDGFSSSKGLSSSGENPFLDISPGMRSPGARKLPPINLAEIPPPPR